METDAKDENFLVLDWTIKNFSRWNWEIHDTVITSSKSDSIPNFWMELELYPRNRVFDLDENLIVRLGCSEPWTFLGELSYIGSDGLIHSTQQVRSNEKVDALELPFGPKIEEVVAEIRKNEAIHGDILTLRYRFKSTKSNINYMCTTVEIFDFSVKLSPKLLQMADSTFYSIASFKYPFQENEKERLDLTLSLKHPIDYTKLLFALQPAFLSKNISVLVRMTVLNNEDEVQRTETKEHLFRNDAEWIFSDSHTQEEMIEKQFSLNLHINIIPKIKYGHSAVFTQYHSHEFLKMSDSIRPSSTTGSTHRGVTDVTSKKPESSVTVLVKELMCVYQDQDFSDFQLKCGDVSFPVHRNILSARSPVFKTMLSTDMQEAASGCMDIEDMDPSTLGLFLAFLYTGGVEDMQCDSALKLYYAADKYQVPTLKRDCTDFLSANVSNSNVCDILSLANKHQDDQLTAAAHEFIVDNYNEVLSSEEWSSFMRNEPLLAVETVTYFAKKKYVRKGDTF